jgi:hypothetical protein
MLTSGRAVCGTVSVVPLCSFLIYHKDGSHVLPFRAQCSTPLLFCLFGHIIEFVLLLRSFSRLFGVSHYTTNAVLCPQGCIADSALWRTVSNTFLSFPFGYVQRSVFANIFSCDLLASAAIPSRRSSCPSMSPKLSGTLSST